WIELERGLVALDGGRQARKTAAGATPPPGAARIALLYRQCCEHLALARERAYPPHLVDRLEALTARAHQRIYRRRDFGLGALRDLALVDAPAAVRALGWHLGVVALVFVLPIILMGAATWVDRTSCSPWSTRSRCACSMACTAPRPA